MHRVRDWNVKQNNNRPVVHLSTNGILHTINPCAFLSMNSYLFVLCMLLLLSSLPFCFCSSDIEYKNYTLCMVLVYMKIHEELVAVIEHIGDARM